MSRADTKVTSAHQSQGVVHFFRTCTNKDFFFIKFAPTSMSDEYVDLWSMSFRLVE